MATITFPSPFTSVPIVTATISGSYFGFIRVNNVTTTGFTVHTLNTTGSPTSLTFMWHAI